MAYESYCASCTYLSEHADYEGKYFEFKPTSYEENRIKIVKLRRQKMLSEVFNFQKIFNFLPLLFYPKTLFFSSVFCYFFVILYILDKNTIK